MEKGKRIQAIDDQLQLPKEIIQHIQSFLDGKQAASTAVLSKSWYNSWLTRPYLDFDERYFQIQNSDEKFLNFVKRSIERYRELNLSIDSFKLWMNVRDIYSSSLATELIVKAVKMGAKFIDLEFNPPISEYLLPPEVFAARSLVGLSVVGCRILGGQIMCSRLKSLRLCKVSIGDDMIRDMMLKCPLIENMFLSDCDGLLRVNLGKMFKLKSCSFIRHVNTPVVWRKPLIEFEDQSVGSVIGDGIIVSEFRNLSYLLLERVKINRMLFSDFSKNFPCVEDLTVRYCSGCRRFDISSNSLKYIALANTRKLAIQLDVPNIRKFKFSGSIIPSLSLVTSSSQWESDIAFTCWNHLDASWFHKLKKILTNLNPSKVFLGIELYRVQGIDFVLPIQDSPIPIVENMILATDSSTSVSPALLDGIFWSFRPKFITLYLFPVWNDKCVKASYELLNLVCKKLTVAGNLKFCSSTNNMIGCHELEEAKAEVYEDAIMEWRPLPWKALYLLHALRSPDKELRIRFQLRWGTT